MADNVTFMRRIYEAWNDRDFDAQADAMASDGKVVIVGSGDVFVGPDGSRKYSESWANGFPDGRITIDNIFADADADADRVVVEFTGRGTHTGTLETSMGAFPATGRSLTIKLCDVVELKDGKVQEQRTYFDTGSMMAQLGLAAEQSVTTNQ